MTMELFDPVLLSRIQFAVTIGFHFIFAPISIGLAAIIAITETFAWLKRDASYERLGRFFAPLLGLTFVVGVATGVPMEFQFGTNWAGYSRFVGDIFGAPLAAEVLFSFFLESSFIALYLFGRNKVPKGVHWFSAMMVSLGSILSAFWILVANSWQQTPAGYMLNAETGRAELTSFWQAVLNPSMAIRFFHVVDAAFIVGAFFVAGVLAYVIIKDRTNVAARRGLKLALVFGVIASVLELAPLGDMHARQVARQQPEKLATFEGLVQGTTHAPFLLFGVPVNDEIAFAVRVPELLSRLVGGTPDTYVPGRNDFSPEDRPPFLLPFASFHLMVGLGMLFIGVTGLGVLLLIRRRLWETKWFLYVLMAVSPLPIVACQLGWIAAEVGRQPWIVYRVFRTAEGVSPLVGTQHVLFSTVMLGIIYLMLGTVYGYLLVRQTKRGAEFLAATERHEVKV